MGVCIVDRSSLNCLRSRFSIESHDAAHGRAVNRLVGLHAVIPVCSEHAQTATRCASYLRPQTSCAASSVLRPHVQPPSSDLRPQTATGCAYLLRRWLAALHAHDGPTGAHRLAVRPAASGASYQARCQMPGDVCGCSQVPGTARHRTGRA